MQAISKVRLVYQLAATALATAKFPHHHALKYKMSLATPLVTVIAIAVAVAPIADTSLAFFS